MSSEEFSGDDESPWESQTSDSEASEDLEEKADRKHRSINEKLKQRTTDVLFSDKMKGKRRLSPHVNTPMRTKCYKVSGTTAKSELY